MTKLASEWVRTSDPVIRSPARYRWTTAPALVSDGSACLVSDGSACMVSDESANPTSDGSACLVSDELAGPV